MKKTPHPLAQERDHRSRLCVVDRPALLTSHPGVPPNGGGWHGPAEYENASNPGRNATMSHSGTFRLRSWVLPLLVGSVAVGSGFFGAIGAAEKPQDQRVGANIALGHK